MRGSQGAPTSEPTWAVPARGWGGWRAGELTEEQTRRFLESGPLRPSLREVVKSCPHTDGVDSSPP
jgi:hypothetical protein